MKSKKQQENGSSQGQSAKPTRLEREAAALRDNLLKRKAQMQQRQAEPETHKTK